LALAIEKRIDAKLLCRDAAHRSRSGLFQAFLPQKGEHSIVCLALDARREQPEVSNVVATAVGDMLGERSQKRSRRVCGLKSLSAARV
jgi:hypothetical protein